MLNDKNIFKIKKFKLYIDFSLALLFIIIFTYLSYYFRELIFLYIGTNGFILLIVVIISGFFYPIRTFFTQISLIEFDKNILKINYLLLNQKLINLTEIKDINVANKFTIINLYHVNQKKPLTIKLFGFNKTDREIIFNKIFDILSKEVFKYSEKEMHKFYDD